MQWGLKFWGAPRPQAPGVGGILESFALQQEVPTGLRQHWLLSAGYGLTNKWGACLFLSRLLRKLAVLREKAQEPLLIFLHPSICGSTCSFIQHWLWVPAPDTKLSAK